MGEENPSQKQNTNQKTKKIKKYFLLFTFYFS